MRGMNSRGDEKRKPTVKSPCFEKLKTLSLFLLIFQLFKEAPFGILSLFLFYVEQSLHYNWKKKTIVCQPWSQGHTDASYVDYCG